MNNLSLKIAACGFLILGAAIWAMPSEKESSSNLNGTADHSSMVVKSVYEQDLTTENQIQLCQATCDCNGGCDSCGGVAYASGGGGGFGHGGGGFGQGGGGFGFSRGQVQQGRFIGGVNQNSRKFGRESRWGNTGDVPWEAFSYGEYIGPHRTPHVPQYRLRVDDQLEFVYLRTREKSLEPYRLYVGDQIQISSAIDTSLNQPNSQLVPGLTIRSDGMVSLSLIGQVRAAGKTIRDLQKELNEKYSKYVKNPAIVIQVIQGDTPLDDILASVDARGGQGGQVRAVTVSPDGTVQLPAIGSVPAIGLTLDEMAREVNARYRLRLGGIEVTPILVERAPRFIYVVGEVTTPGRYELLGPTSAIQAIALAEGENVGGNLRQVIVFRRDENWRLTATRLDLNGALLGRRPYPSDEIWLRDSDIVLVPQKPIQRFSDAVNLYLASTLYSIFPQQGVVFDFDGFTSL